MNLKDKYKGMSFSDIATKIDEKYKDRGTSLTSKKSFEVEMQSLHNEQVKAQVVDTMTTQLKQFKKGGMLPKYPNGGLLGDPTKPDGLGQDEFNIMNPPVPPTLASINPLDNPTVPQVNSLSTLNTPTYTIGERLGKAFSGLVGNRNNPAGGTTNNSEMSAYAPALIGQGISTAINAGILSKGYDKVSPVDNPNESRIENLMASRGIDTTQQRNSILSAYNAARANLTGSRSMNVKNALDTNLLNVTQDNLAESKLNEQQLNNQYKGDFAQTLGSLGQQKVNARNLAEQLTAQNKSTFENNLSYFGDLMAQHGESFSAFKANQNMNTALAQLLNDKYASTNLGISQDMVNKFNSGKATEQDWLELKTKIKEVNPNMTIPEFKVQ